MWHTRGQRGYGMDALATHWERKEIQNLSQIPSLERILRALRDETVVPWAPLGLIPKASTSQGSEGLDRAAQYLRSPIPPSKSLSHLWTALSSNKCSCVSSCHTALFRE